jgi:predicted phosphoadenosine phosphosulfate sulfurtransferase
VKIYGRLNVYEAALKRIRWLFDEFENVVVNVSGGKDSTVVFNLAMLVAAEKKRLPLKVMFLDQEAEWQATIDQIRLIMERPDVTPLWYQMPFKLFNATSTVDHWLQCWDPKEEHRWMRPKESCSIKENTFGEERFAALFDAVLAQSFPGQSACYITGLRADESSNRMFGLTSYETYRGATWGKIISHKTRRYSFHPIYDWGTPDVWKAIHDNGWHYNAIYDAQYAYGVPLARMRVSNVHHETAVNSLFYMQEVEPETYERLTQRIAGIDMAGKLGTADYFVRTLPPMFKSWREYRDYLFDNLILVPEWRENMSKWFRSQEAIFGESCGDGLYRAHIASILTNDWEGVKMSNFQAAPQNAKVWKAHRVANKARREAAKAAKAAEEAKP